MDSSRASPKYEKAEVKGKGLEPPGTVVSSNDTISKIDKSSRLESDSIRAGSPTLNTLGL